VALIPADEDELDVLEARIDAWLDRTRGENPVVAAVERGEPGERRWYVRLVGEQKGPFTIWFTLRQRTLHHETYVAPAPAENHAQFYEQLLRRNLQMRGMAFAIGDEDALYIVGQVPVDQVDDAHLDWVLGAVWTYVEQYFRPAMRIGFASMFRG
jgi:hypothetical protein